MKKSVFILLMFVFCPLVADQDAEAYRLLKSWGMQYDSKGNLHFRPQQKTADTGAKPWKPEIPVYQANG